MGGGGSKQQTETDVITKIMTNVIAKSIQNCKLNVVALQEIDLSNIEGLVLEHITMDQAFTAQVSCDQTSEQMAKIQNEIVNKIMQESSQTQQALLGAINALTGEKNEQLTKTLLETVVESQINLEMIQNIVSDINQKQILRVNGAKNSVIRDINMGQTTNIIMEAAQAGVQSTEVINQMNNDAEQSADQTQRNPIADTVDAIGRAGSNILSGLGNIFTGPLMYIMLMVIIFVITAMIIRKGLGSDSTVVKQQQPIDNAGTFNDTTDEIIFEES